MAPVKQIHLFRDITNSQVLIDGEVEHLTNPVFRVTDDLVMRLSRGNDKLLKEALSDDSTNLVEVLVHNSRMDKPYKSYDRIDNPIYYRKNSAVFIVDSNYAKTCPKTFKQIPKYKDLKTTKFDLPLFDIVVESDYITGEFVSGKCVNHDGKPTRFSVTRSTFLDRDVLLVVAHGALVSDSIAEIQYDNSFDNRSFGVDVIVSKPNNSVRLDFIIFDKHTRKIIEETSAEFTDIAVDTEEELPVPENVEYEVNWSTSGTSSTTVIGLGLFKITEFRIGERVSRSVEVSEYVPDGCYIALERDCGDVKYVDIVNVSDKKTYLTYRADLIDSIGDQN